tara:strand:- start:2095 stop:2469 length:375 start_codon:yes stop_codon:yes gene_type:complete
MSYTNKPKPKIITPFDDKQRFKNLVLEVIKDMEIFTHTPDSISLDGSIFTLTLNNKKLVYQDISVDDIPEYVDVFLQGVKKASDTYGVTDNGTNVVIVFTESITLNPDLIVNTDFSVKGKIVSR